MMNSQPMLQYPQYLIFDVKEAVSRFTEAVHDLSPELEKRYQEILPWILPLLDSYIYMESKVGALAFNMWDAFQNVPSEDMERYTDAVMSLADSIASEIHVMGYYNHEGECIYLYSQLLGNSVVMKLRPMEIKDYQLF